MIMSPMARLPAVHAILIGVVGASAAACAATVPLDKAVLAYDRKTVDSTSLLLLLNIARARHNLPMHFTTVSSIAATYRYTFNGGAGPALTGDKGWLILPTLGGSAEENPTITLAPMQGDEFTQRLLTPFPEQKLTLLLRQGYDVDALLRLLGAEIRVRSETGAVDVYHNRPSDRTGYMAYRHIMSHLSSIQDLNSLQVEPLHFEYVWSVPEASVTPETYLTTFKDLSLTPDPNHKAYRVAKRVNGRVMITNYDPSTLTNEERFRLHEEAEALPATDIIVDIRPGNPGGAMPLHGTLRLRSFHEVLTFIGRGMAEEPEFDVAPDVRTPQITENPPRALEIVETPDPPASGDLSVSVNGLHYAVREQRGYQWNQKAFNMLAQLLQMSVSAVPQAGPAITISK
jgi:hypothetical protein